MSWVEHGRRRRDGAAPWRSDVALLWLAGALVTLGVVNALFGPMFDAPTKDRIENVTEWWASLVFTFVFVALAALWRHNRVLARLTDSGG